GEVGAGPWRRPRNLNTPRRPFVTDSLRGSRLSLGSPKLRADASVPKTYDLGEQPNSSRVPFVTASLRTIRIVTRLDKDASSRVRPVNHRGPSPTLQRLGLPFLFRRGQRGFRCRLGITPRLLVTQHGPRTHQDLARHRHDRLLLATLAAAREPQVDAT